MKIEILIQCHNFQRRLCWMLSSLFNQDCVATLVPQVATLAGNGDPNTESIIQMFNSINFRVKHLIIDDVDKFAYRGCVRNKQVTALDEDTDWVLFTDSDMVYESGFFRELEFLLNTLPSESKIYSVGRFSSDVDQTNKLVDDYCYPCYFPETDMIKQLCNIPRRNCGAGYFQLVRKSDLAGYYIAGRAKDKHLFKDGQKARSDIQFRKRFGLVKFNMINSQWHLNHVRDNELGQHTEVQR